MVRFVIDHTWICLNSIIRSFTNPDGSQREVHIIEYVDPKSIRRILEPQSGNHIRAICRYKVMTTDPVGDEITKVEEMTMEQLHDEHPWYFAAVRN